MCSKYANMYARFNNQGDLGGEEGDLYEPNNNLHFDNEWDACSCVLQNGYAHDLDLLIALH